MKRLALIAYESRFARCGGVTAVMNTLPGSLRDVSGIDTCVITPYHHRILETTKLAAAILGEILVPFAGQDVRVRILRHEDRWPWIFLDTKSFTIPGPFRHGTEDVAFFSGRRHPYDVGQAPGDQLPILRRDALFFGVAVARALDVLGPDSTWALLLQDWQAATTALALAGSSQAAGCHLTLHNSYDSGGVWPNELRRVGIDPAKVPGADSAEASTVLNRAFPVLQRPIFTVSDQFALDFTEDVFQREVMANQLQHALRPPNVVGVNNEPFAKLAIPEAALLAAQERDYRPLHQWKLGQKQKAIEALRGFRPSGDRPAWGGLTPFVQQAGRADTPWFILAGRDDTRQKGYDVAAAALGTLLAEPAFAEAAQFLFFPIPGDEDRAGLSFLRDVAEKFPANVLVLPFIFVEGFVAALQGSAFGVMPSLYEPFGMANEFYLNGAVGVGRATGGLVQQIVPLRSVPSFTPAVAARADRWHRRDAAATGLLFRESDDLPDAALEWRTLNEAGYVVGGHPNRIEQRSPCGLYRAMAGGLRQTLVDALDLYRTSPGHDEYYALLSEGVRFIQTTLSWEASAKKYLEFMQ